MLAEHPERLGYLLKDRVTDPDEFVHTLHRVAAGGTALDAQVVARLLAKDDGGPLKALTEREREALQLVGQGLSNPAIAEQLGITLRSTEKHISSVFSKLGLPDTGTENRRVLAVLAAPAPLRAEPAHPEHRPPIYRPAGWPAHTAPGNLVA